MATGSISHMHPGKTRCQSRSWNKYIWRWSTVYYDLLRLRNTS